jgi:D-alanyl-D-alanine carboxypeptidase/D-alanyl-D-alanine-endopeptidase (penicillin-binding protein 4)
MWDDEPEAFMPHVSGLTVDRGCVTVTVRAGEPDSIVSMTPASDHLEVRRSLDAGPVRIVRHPVRRPFTVHVSGTPSGAAPASRTISVPAPALHAGRVFKAILMRRGLATGDVRVVTSPLGEGGEILAVRERRLPELLARSNGPSDNLVTELLLRHLGTPDVARSRGRVGGPDAGLDKVRDHLTACGVDPAGYRLADGSGVSHYNLVSAHLLVALLRDLRGRPGPGWALLRESLPRAGRDGTLKGRFRDTPALGHVRAKTGTISGVSALAGVISAKAGENDAAVVFAILVQNFTGPARPWRVLQERIVLALMERAGLGG